MAEEKEKPLTREDILKMIEGHSGPEGLDLSRRNLKGITLSSPASPLDLHGIILRHAELQGAYLGHANLQGAYLRTANLQGAHLRRANLQGADLRRANLQGAYLGHANLQGAYLSDAKLQGAYLRYADLRGAVLWRAKLHQADLRYCDLRGTKTNLAEADLEGAKLYVCDLSEANVEAINWGPKYIVGDEQEADRETKKGNRELLGQAASVYCNLKRWHTEQGLYNLAGEFYFREMTVRRKALEWWPNPLPRIRQTLYWLLCGYGERPWQVFASAAVVILGLALVYFAIGTLTPNTFQNSLYYSAVSFTALGYGKWAPEPTSWVKGLGAFEAFVGVFMMALFLVTFTRKMTR